METNSVVFFNSGEYPELKTKPIIAGWKITNPANIGSLMRLADNIGCSEVFILGEKFDFRKSSIKYTAGQSFETVKLNFISPEDFFESIPKNHQLVAIETSEHSKNIFTTPLPSDIIFLLGNERYGLPDDILNRCKLTVHIPMTGACKSMNVSHAAAVALFEWQRQQFFLSATK